MLPLLVGMLLTPMTITTPPPGQSATTPSSEQALPTGEPAGQDDGSIPEASGDEWWNISLGIGGGTTSTDATGGQGQKALSVHHRGNVYAAVDNLNFAVDWDALLGGGTGFAGGFALNAHEGLRIPVGLRHGPFVRMGFGGGVFGNDVMYYSIADWGAEVGYQILTRDVVFDLGVRGAAVAVGRYKTVDFGYRKLGATGELAPFATVRVEPVLAQLSWRALSPPEKSDLGWLHVVQASLCGTANPVAVCTEWRHFQGDQYAESDDTILRDIDSNYVGISIGLGFDGVRERTLEGP